MERNEDVVVYVKLPRWFRVPTPVGDYNPDWAVVLKHECRHRLYFVVETKSTLDLIGLRQEEKDKIHCGQRHFESLADGPDAAEFVQAAEFGDVLGAAVGSL